ncbi:MAG: recombinase RecA [Armatimonadota bacterium]
MEKERALELALSQIEKQFGKGSVMRLGESAKNAAVEAIPTGSLALDIALGIGGIPKGRVTEIYGAESSGKTTVALQIVAQAQKQGGIAAYVDVEHAIDPKYAANIGVDIDNMLISQPDTGEEALEVIDALIRSNAVSLVVLDSVAALVPKAEIEGDMGASLPGLQARLMSQALRKITGSLNKTGTAAIFINQIREKIGVMFGNPETQPGGRALKFYSSVRMDCRRVETLKTGTENVGIRTRVKIVKNKVAPPFKQAEFDIMFGEGISRSGSIIDIGTELSVITKAGAFYSYKGERLGQGRENAKKFLDERPEMMQTIEDEIKNGDAAKEVLSLGAIAED